MGYFEESLQNYKMFQWLMNLFKFLGINVKTLKDFPASYTNLSQFADGGAEGEKQIDAFFEQMVAENKMGHMYASKMSFGEFKFKMKPDRFMKGLKLEAEMKPGDIIQLKDFKGNSYNKVVGKGELVFRDISGTLMVFDEEDISLETEPTITYSGIISTDLIPEEIKAGETIKINGEEVLVGEEQIVVRNPENNELVVFDKEGLTFNEKDGTYTAYKEPATGLTIEEEIKQGMSFDLDGQTHILGKDQILMRDLNDKLCLFNKDDITEEEREIKTEDTYVARMEAPTVDGWRAPANMVVIDGKRRLNVCQDDFVIKNPIDGSYEIVRKQVFENGYVPVNKKDEVVCRQGKFYGDEIFLENGKSFIASEGDYILTGKGGGVISISKEELDEIQKKATLFKTKDNKFFFVDKKTNKVIDNFNTLKTGIFNKNIELTDLKNLKEFSKVEEGEFKIDDPTPASLFMVGVKKTATEIAKSSGLDVKETNRNFKNGTKIIYDKIGLLKNYVDSSGFGQKFFKGVNTIKALTFFMGTKEAKDLKGHTEGGQEIVTDGYVNAMFENKKEVVDMPELEMLKDPPIEGKVYFDEVTREERIAKKDDKLFKYSNGDLRIISQTQLEDAKSFYKIEKQNRQIPGMVMRSNADIQKEQIANENVHRKDNKMDEKAPLSNEVKAGIAKKIRKEEEGLVDESYLILHPEIGQVVATIATEKLRWLTGNGEYVDINPGDYVVKSKEGATVVVSPENMGHHMTRVIESQSKNAVADPNPDSTTNVLGEEYPVSPDSNVVPFTGHTEQQIKDLEDARDDNERPDPSRTL